MVFKVGRKLYINLMRKNDKKRLAGLRTFGVTNTRADVSYFEDDLKEHKLDIIYPATGGNGITILYIHGGSYIYGYKESSAIFTSYFVSKGFNVIAMNYRLANHKEDISIMNQVHDVFLALDFIRKNRVYYKINTEKFAIMGDSAGGHLALLTNIIYHDKEAQNFFKIKKLPDIKISCYSLDSPMYDLIPLRDGSLKMLKKSLIKDMFTKEYRNDEYLMKLSPRYYIKKDLDLTPMFINTSLHDYFKSQSELLNREHSSLKYPLEYYVCESPDKKIDHVYNHFVFDKEGQVCNDKIIDFILRHVSVEK